MDNCLAVLVVAQYFPPDMGGASTRASNVVTGLLRKGCKVKVIAAFPHYPYGHVPRQYRGKAVALERIGDAEVFRVWIPAFPHSSIVNRIILHFCFIISSLFALPWVGKVDVIWAANPNMISFFPVLIYSWVKRKPIVRNVDDLWPEVFYELGLVKSRLMKELLDFLAWLSYVVPSAITPISTGYKRRITEKYRVRSEKVHVVEVGVASVKPFRVVDRMKDEFVIMYSGVIGLGYDYNIILKAANLLGEYKDIIFIIRGVGNLAPSLRRQIKRLNLKNVVFDTRFLPKEELSILLESANVFFLPMASIKFVEDGLPTKIFEYQSYGKPIICCSAGEPARYIQLTKSGLVIKPGDLNNCVNAILKLYKERKLAFELGMNGWNYVSENMTSERIGERMYDIFLSIKGC